MRKTSSAWAIRVHSRAVVFTACLLLAASTRAGLTGDTVTCAPVSAQECSTSQATVSAGAEFTFAFTLGQFDFDDSGLTASGGNSLVLLPHYPDITFTDLTLPFTGFSFVSSSVGGFDASDVSLNGGVLTLHLGDTSWGSEGAFRINLTNEVSISVPEPATLALLGIGLAGLAASRRRKAN